MSSLNPFQSRYSNVPAWIYNGTMSGMSNSVLTNGCGLPFPYYFNSIPLSYPTNYYAYNRDLSNSQNYIQMLNNSPMTSIPNKQLIRENQLQNLKHNK